MSTFGQVKYNDIHETLARARAWRLGAPGAFLLRAAGQPAHPGRRSPALPRPVPRPAPDRARPPRPHGPARGDPGLRRLQRDRPRGPPGVARLDTAAAVRGGPPGEGTGPHPHRLPTP